MARYAYYTNNVIYDICSSKDDKKNSVLIDSSDSGNTPRYTIKFTNVNDTADVITHKTDLGYLISDGDTYKNNKFVPMGYSSYWGKKLMEFSDKYTKNLDRGNIIDIPFYYKSASGTITANTLSLSREFGLTYNAKYNYVVTIQNENSSYTSFNADTIVMEYVENEAIKLLNIYDDTIDWEVTINSGTTANAPGHRPGFGDETEDSGTTENSGTTSDSGTTSGDTTTSGNTGTTEVIIPLEFSKFLTVDLYGSYSTGDTYNAVLSSQTSDDSGEMWFINDWNQFAYVVTKGSGENTKYDMYMNLSLSFSQSMPSFSLKDYISPIETNSEGELIAPQNKDKVYVNLENGKYYKWNENGKQLDVYNLA